MIRTQDNGFTNPGEIEDPETAAELFPGFYAANQERIDAGRIVLITEMWAQEAGLFLDLDTLKSIFIDFRS